MKDKKVFPALKAAFPPNPTHSCRFFSAWNGIWNISQVIGPSSLVSYSNKYTGLWGILGISPGFNVAFPFSATNCFLYLTFSSG